MHNEIEVITAKLRELRERAEEKAQSDKEHAADYYDSIIDQVTIAIDALDEIAWNDDEW